MGEKRDFVRLKFKERENIDNIWSIQYVHFSTPLKKSWEEISQYGVQCILQFSLADLKKIEGYKVFSLFAHYNKERQLLELSDGLYTIDEFVASIPIGFKGIFDITACHSIYLRDGIKAKFNNQVIAYKEPLGIHGFMAFYKQIISNLNKYEINFIDCFTKTIEDLKK